jgi:hypothetical protein
VTMTEDARQDGAGIVRCRDAADGTAQAVRCQYAQRAARVGLPRPQRGAGTAERSGAALTKHGSIRQLLQP